MSSIFSIETADDIESAASRPTDGLLGTAMLGTASSAYGLDWNEHAVGSAIAPSLDDLSWDKASRSEGEAPNVADHLLSDFLESHSFNVHPSTSAHVDELTGISEGEDLLSHIAGTATSTSSVSGSLSFGDYFNPTRLYAFKDDYLFSSQRTETVQLNLDSSIFDAYLQLVDASSGRLLAFDDDGGEGSNSQLSFTAQAGRQYAVRVTSYSSYETGSYDLTAYIGAGDQPNPPINPPGNPPHDFNSVYGYGLVDAATAVATAVGQSRFNPVADIGGDQWNNDMINAPEVWNQGYTGEGITVAVIDSGVDISHGDLRNNIWQNTGEVFGDGIDNDGNGYIDDRYGWNFGRGQNNFDVRPGTSDIGQGHGTHVAGTIAAANNGRGMTGVAYNSNIMAIRMGDVQTDPVNGGRFVNGGDLAEAIRYAVDNGADIINMSLGWGDPTGSVREALAYASERNVIAVMASGNNRLSAPSSPANNAIDYGISVGAVTQTGVMADFSNRAGSNPQMHHVMAPGQSIYSTIPNDEWGFQGGTSMAAPHVAGVVALMLSANPDLTHAQVREILVGTTFNSTATSQTAQTVQSNQLENTLWNRNAAIPDTNRWSSLAVESNRNSFVSLSGLNPGLNRDESEMIQGADIVSDFLIERSARMQKASYADDWQYEMPQPLVESDLLVGAIA